MVASAGIEPATRGFSVLCSTDWAMKPQMAVPTGFEPAIFCVTGRRDRPLHYGTIKHKLVAGDGFDPTTSGLWARRATRLLHPAINNIFKMAEEKGFEPLRRFHDLPVFKTGPFNQTWVFLHNRWGLRSDLNRHEGWISQDFKSCASTCSATWAAPVSFIKTIWV